MCVILDAQYSPLKYMACTVPIPVIIWRDIVTKINFESLVVRETASLYKNKPIIVELHSGYVFRVKGMRSIRASVSYEGAFHRAA